MGRRVVLYLRVSTDGQRESLDAQEAAVREGAARFFPDVPAELVTVTREVGKRDDPGRPAFRELLRSVRRGELRAVVAKDLTRLCAGMTAAGELCAALQAGETELVTLDGRFDFRGPAGRMILAVLAELSAMELEQHRRRCREGLARARARGIRNGRARTVLPKPIDDYARAVSLGASVRGLARRDRVAESTLRRHLADHARRLAADGDAARG